MAITDRFRGHSHASPASSTMIDQDPEKKPQMLKGGVKEIFRMRIIAMAIIVSMGGFIFGYDTGQISGFLEMPDFLDRFADQTDPETGGPAFSNWKSGLIVALLSIGTLMGALIAAPVADRFGRKYSIVFWNIIFCVGVIVQITTVNTWYQISLGRWVAGLGVGALSVLTPMYQSETAPRYVRGALVSCYQLFITLGIFTAYAINFGTEARLSSWSWKVPMGIGFIWSALMIVGILFMQESPRWEYRKGKIESATHTVALTYGVPEDHPEVQREIQEIQKKFEAENAGGDTIHVSLVYQATQKQHIDLLSSYFYYGTTIFQSVGIQNSYVTSMILGGVNFGMTIPGLYVVEKFGRRSSLIVGGLWMSMCFLVFASVGHFVLTNPDGSTSQGAGYAMIIFACLFIAGYAMTWGPIIWAVIGEIYPSRYRAKAMALATASNWTWNFLISFFTPYITAAIDYRYGYVFAACCFTGAVVVYFFVCESHGRTLEEIDTMYILHVTPWKSKHWTPTPGEELPALDNTYLTPGARGIKKGNEARAPEQMRTEDVPVTDADMQASGARKE
ncbi:high affinity glucose transporter ght1 [Pyrenophora tritici-repentis Pt-1C-BFP]|uniref:High affinity glucose transporter ght1 n=1 Tax=Pyrenophora tritici-repentis (strain Pt-1C-BFP) TaxID=426418 RepID=B2W163_PYRTR|nr:high affinity glucose transporter ght1 [Pyrenophora tritici-repentis Pt-1C-BFP]EDU47036.1 high affinity glucose transporter ght1 [Pyrenophora tritici-repentis Pt-1C-BFP]